MCAIHARTTPPSIGCARSIREFGFKIPVLALSDREVVDGHLRLRAACKQGSWHGGETIAIPVILCEEWSPAQVKHSGRW
jgi:ParB-like chromosome segregation protein Spo0J